MARSESLASQISKHFSRPMCAALSSSDGEQLRARLTPEFRGRLAEAGPQTVDGDLARRSFTPTQESLDREAFATRLGRVGRGYRVVERCKLKVRSLLVATDERWAWVRLDYTLVGLNDAGLREMRRGVWEGELVAEKWRARKLAVTKLEVITSRAPGFTEVAAQVGMTLDRSAMTRRVLNQLRNEQALESIGGLAVVDLDHDGRQDVVAWNGRRTLSLYRNDGRGGFERRELLPPQAVGFAQLLVGLDGDGQEELTSSEAQGCRAGRAYFGVYTGRWDTGFRATAKLPFTTRCEKQGLEVFQHIAAQDIDGDGDLDLFVSGYGEETSTGQFNKFSSEAGARNLLFVNQGGLRFTEEGEARGIAGTRMTYTATFFDHEADGDPDLLVVNDFGPNEVYLNDGRGRFEALKDGGPLTENGQSMGVTVADFDGDGAFDVYISNMYSYAGHRIVPLASKALKPETWAELMSLAKGNTLWLRRGETYVEAAASQGVANAQWAWGQSFVDLDNDGDRELYVVNGMTSHDQAREHDY